MVAARVGIFRTDRVVAEDNPRLQVTQRALDVIVFEDVPERGDEMGGVRPLLLRERLIVEAGDEVVPVDGHCELL